MSNKQSLLTDGISVEDKLRRKPLAKEVAEMLLNSFSNGHDSFVLGIEGEWGSGKTNFLSYLKDELDNNENKKNLEADIIVISFNPWLFDDHKSILISLLKLMYKKADGHNDVLKRAIEKVVEYLDILQIPLDANIPNGGKIIEPAKKFLSNYSKWDFEEIKKEINQSLQNKNTRLFIQIDDLDRLLPMQLIEILKIIRLIAEFKNTTFIVTYDKAVVTKILNKEFGYNGSDYLEKIIQLELKLPEPLPEDLYSLYYNSFSELLDNLNLSDEKSHLQELWTKGLNKVLNNPRDIIRLHNSIRLPIIRLKKNVVIKQLIALEAIRVFFFEDYNILKDYHQVSKRYSKEPLELSNDTSILIYGNILIENKDIADSISYINNLNFSNPHVTNRYFTYNLKDDEVETQLIIEITHNPNFYIKGVFYDCYKNQKIENLLSRLIGFNWSKVDSGIKSKLISESYEFLLEIESNLQSVLHNEFYNLIKSVTFSYDRSEGIVIWLNNIKYNYNSSISGFFHAYSLKKDISYYKEIINPKLNNLLTEINDYLKNFIEIRKQTFFSKRPINSYSEFCVLTFFQCYEKINPNEFYEEVIKQSNADLMFKLLKNYMFKNLETGFPTSLIEQIPLDLCTHWKSLIMKISFKEQPEINQAYLNKLLPYMLKTKVITQRNFDNILNS